MGRGTRAYTVNLHLDSAGNLLSAGLVCYSRTQDIVGLAAMTPEPFEDASDVVRQLLHQRPHQPELFDQGPVETGSAHS